MTELERLLKVHEYPKAAEHGVLDALVDQCLDYIQKVVDTEIIRAKRPSMDAEIYRTSLQEAETSRRASHNALIAKVDLVNRLCDMAGVEKVYQGGEGRAEYGDFAMRLIEQIYGGRVR